MSDVSWRLSGLLFHFHDDYGEWYWADLAKEVPSSAKEMKISQDFGFCQ